MFSQVLSDPQKRSIYDQDGEEGLKDMPPTGSSGGGGFRNGFNPRNAEDIFAEFFGSSPFAFGSGGAGRSMRYQSDNSAGFGNYNGHGRSFSDGANGNAAPKKPPPVESKLPCSLEELYTGSTRKMKISRTVVDANGYVFFDLFSFCNVHFYFLCGFYPCLFCSKYSSMIELNHL